MNDRLLNPAAVLIAMAACIFVLLILSIVRQSRNRLDVLGISLGLVFFLIAFFFLN